MALDKTNSRVRLDKTGDLWGLDKIGAAMIYLTSGLPGSGKTLLTVTRVRERAEKEKRPVFYLGVPGVTVPGWTELADFKSWLDCPANALIIIDECQTVLPALSRGKGVPVPPEVAGFSTHRHRGVDVYLISQDPMQFDHFVRRLVGVHMHCVRPFGMTYCTVWEFQSVQGFKQSEAAAGFYDKISTKSRFDYPRESFALYKSAEVHTHKRRLPWLKLVGVLALVGSIGVAGYLAWGTVKGFTKGAESASVKSEKGSPASALGGGFVPVLGGSKAAAVSGREYILQRVPRIQSLPESAPVFDDLAKVVAFPRLAGCMKTPTSCSCVTQQGTPVADVPGWVCEEFVKHGAFDPYRAAQVVAPPVPAIAPPVPAPVVYQMAPAVPAPVPVDRGAVAVPVVEPPAGKRPTVPAP